MNNIKMSDVFHTPIHAGDIPRLNTPGDGSVMLKRKAVAMAVNKHDGLVEENERLKAVVQQLGVDVYDAYEWEAMTHSGHWEKDAPEERAGIIKDYIQSAEKHIGEQQ
jgi:hypothetical protein